MKEIILKVLARFGCSENGQHCQVNLQSEGAREMIANKLEEELQPHVNKLIEEILVGISKEYKRLKEDEPI